MTDNWQTVEIPSHPIKDGRWVAVTAHIRNEATNEIRQYATHEILDNQEATPDPSHWETGNYACDCNRESFFRRAGNEPDPDNECSLGRYSVNLHNAKTGECYYQEFTP